MSELLNCPFCGSRCVTLLNGGPGNHYVRCDDCLASSNDVGRDRAVELWNRRTLAPAQRPVSKPWTCCHCDTDLSCSACGVEQPNDSAYYEDILKENKTLKAAQGAVTREQVARVIAGKIECEKECQAWPSGCGCSDDAADAVMALYSPAHSSTGRS